ncbi:MAG TPA: FAD-dependent thymidylate synthase [Bryobacteraceae bacterium]|nr:FAD-dependent thymidylate synthase [Bryobacteraceae bacterium]
MAKRVIAVAPMPPEKSAYALARYSRSADSIRDSIEWVRTHNSQQFLESYYFQYGHQSIADLGHTVLCFEGISELAASEIEDEALWDGQAKSSRYQDFSASGFVTPPELSGPDADRYRAAAEGLIAAYRDIHSRMDAWLREKLPRPDSMKPEPYARNIAARAFDVARYLLFWGVPTNVGQVTSIRTLEKQIRRLRVAEFAEVRELGAEIAQACADAPECVWESAHHEPLAPTLARHADPDVYLQNSHADLKLWADQNLKITDCGAAPRVDLIKPVDTLAEIAATLLYPVCPHSFRALYDAAMDWSKARRMEVLEAAVKSRGSRDDLLRGFRGGQYCFDMLIDIGAYRDMHRHRRCQQYRQGYSGFHGYDAPAALSESGAEPAYRAAMDSALAAMRGLPDPGRQYLLPFGARSRFLFKMDFAEVEYISRVRSGVKGHFSYREIAWEMKQRVDEIEPELGRLIAATPPWVEDPLKR